MLNKKNPMRITSRKIRMKSPKEETDERDTDTEVVPQNTQWTINRRSNLS